MIMNGQCVASGAIAWEGVRIESGTLAVLDSGSNLQILARHGQLEADSRNPSDGIQVWQDNDGVHV